MLVIISPVKTLDFKTGAPTALSTVPEYLDQSKKLVSVLKRFTPTQLSELMNISPKLAQLNYEEQDRGY